MFETKAEEYANEHNHEYYTDNDTFGACFSSFQDGATFGYNKANEWHYVKDGDLPKDMENVLINALDYGINTCYVAHRLNGNWRSNCSSEVFAFVIAWKEIVLPDLKGDF